MPDLNTEYLGLQLSSPIVVSASPLSENIDTVQQMERLGAGAVVLFSLFEEQIELEEMGHSEYYTEHIEALPEELQDIARMTYSELSENKKALLNLKNEDYIFDFLKST